VSSRWTQPASRRSAARTVRTYLPAGDPFTTTITLVGGRVFEIERIHKF
jgi:hypothetical protein